MEQYLFKITKSFSHKNKLYEAFSDHVHTLDCTLIKGKDTLEAFKDSLLYKLNTLNQEFPRCKPIEIREMTVRSVMYYSGEGSGAETLGFEVEGSWAASVYRIERAVECCDSHLQYFIPDANNPKINL